MDLLVVDGGSSVLKARTQYIKENSLVEVSGLLHCDVVNSDCHQQIESFVLRLMMQAEIVEFVL